MKVEIGRGVICLHDTTTHGGEVIAACDDVKAMWLDNPATAYAVRQDAS